MLDTLEALAPRAAAVLPSSTAHWSLRGVVERSEKLALRQDVAEAPQRSRDAGVMLSVIDGGQGFAATADTSEAGLAAAFLRAHALARAGAGRAVFDFGSYTPPRAAGRYASAVQKPIASASLGQKLDWLRGWSAAAQVDARVVDRAASLWSVQTEQLQIDSAGSCIAQRWSFLTPSLSVTAHAGGVTQVRTQAGQYNGWCQQGGLEVLDRAGLDHAAARVAHEAVELALAPSCPSGSMDLLLMPDQMMLQIHESIGHPLELDRILGDERNFAGTSFVTPDMFGHYRYGSELLNVSHDPTQAFEFASFGHDDEGSPATREMIIEAGLLKRPLGGHLSQARARAAGLPLDGVATARACSWNRAPIDRMSNLNVEPGSSTLDEMIAATEHGVLMRTNCSWSIDDSRNKFQFGCEHGQVIRHGRLAEVVRTPNYRGISATFWRSLARVGDASTFEVMGTPYCGKGEPAQVIRVGHAAPACLFRGVDVFGAAS